MITRHVFSNENKSKNELLLLKAYVAVHGNENEKRFGDQGSYTRTGWNENIALHCSNVFIDLAHDRFWELNPAIFTEELAVRHALLLQ